MCGRGGRGRRRAQRSGCCNPASCRRFPKRCVPVARSYHGAGTVRLPAALRAAEAPPPPSATIPQSARRTPPSPTLRRGHPRSRPWANQTLSATSTCRHATVCNAGFTRSHQAPPWRLSYSESVTERASSSSTRLCQKASRRRKRAVSAASNLRSVSLTSDSAASSSAATRCSARSRRLCLKASSSA
jgi:hypothetical protein